MPGESSVFDLDHELVALAADHKAGCVPQSQIRYREILKAAPDHADVLFVLGVSEAQLERFDEALASIDRAIRINPGAMRYYLAKASLLQQQARAQEAIENYRSAFHLDPRSEQVFAAIVDKVARSVGDGSMKRNFIRASRIPVAEKKRIERSISVIVCSIDREKQRRIRRHYQDLLAGWDFEVIQITDAKSLSEAYNRGFRRSSGDVVIFSHDDIEIVSEHFAARLLTHFETHDVLGVAGTSKLAGPSWISSGWPFMQGGVAHRLHDRSGASFSFAAYGPPRPENVEAMDGVFFAAKRNVCEAVPFDEAIFDGFHFYDLDFTYRAHIAGFNAAVCWDILAVHDSAGAYDAVWCRYAGKFAAKYPEFVLRQTIQKPIKWPSVGFQRKEELIEFHRRMLKVLNIAAS